MRSGFIMDCKHMPVLRSEITVTLLAPFIFGLLVLWLGKDASWDFLNYHYYNPYSFLTGRFGFDVAVGHHATYYNPLVDIPFFLMAQYVPDWLAGFVLGSIQGGNCVLLFWLARAVFRNLKPASLRFQLSLFVALAGMLGGGAIGQLGAVAYDNVVSLGVLASLCLIAWRWETGTSARAGLSLPWVTAAGILAGSAAGLKLTASIYAVGICVALLFSPGSLRHRFFRAAVFGAGVLIGLTTFAGYWSLKLWQETGNPFFPYFNTFFHSPLVSVHFNRDEHFIPRTLIGKLFFPFAFTRNPLLTSDFFFRDIHIVLLYVLLPAGLLVSFRHRGAEKSLLGERQIARFVLTMAAVSYLVWLQIFCIYRYITALEMLSPLLLALCVDLLPITRRVKVGGLVALLAISQAAVQGIPSRLSWSGTYVGVGVPPISRPLNSMVLATGYTPISYVIPSFPSRIPFLRIQSWMTGRPNEKENGLDLKMRRRVAAFDGDLYVLFAKGDVKATKEALDSYHLTMITTSCRLVPSNVAPALRFCSLRKESGGDGSTMVLRNSL